MKVLVAGGAGYIGGAVTDVLAARSISFTVYDSLIYESHYLKPVSFIHGDIRDREKLARLLPEYSHVIWLAALVGDGACAVKPDLTKEINRDSVAWLAGQYNGRIIFMSTCSVYGEHDKAVNENGAVKPLSLYAETKLQAEGNLLDKNALIFRLGTAFGISDTYARPRMDLVVNAMSMSAILKGEITINGGDQWRPLIHVKDIARLTVDNLNRNVSGIYNLATVNTTIRKIGQAVIEETGCNYEVIPMNSVDARNYRADITKAREDGVIPSGFRSHTINDGVREFVQLAESGRIVDPASSQYFNVRTIKETMG
jgi:nucleoside-diphosphate-sugar epimerase